MVVAKSEAPAAHLGVEALADRHKENVMAIFRKAAGGMMKLRLMRSLALAISFGTIGTTMA